MTPVVVWRSLSCAVEYWMVAISPFTGSVLPASGYRNTLSVSFSETGSRVTMDFHCAAPGLISISFSLKLTVISAGPPFTVSSLLFFVPSYRSKTF